MKRRVFSLSALIVVLVVVGSLTITEQAAAESPINGFWYLYYWWFNSPGYEETGLHIQMYSNLFGRFTTDDGGQGIALYLGWNDKVFLIFQNGAKPIYVGALDTERTMSGTMQERKGTDNGIWNAVR